MDMTGWIILAVVVLVAFFAVGVYNGLIQLKNKVDEAWADIETQLKRRYDLIPNIVETVKGYAGHEKSTLENVTKARNMAMSAGTMADKAQAENALTGTLKSLFALAENYPDLKANQNFMDLQQTLKDIEEHLQLSRRYYNATVRDFNTKVELFPNNIFAGIFNFKRRDFFQVDSEEERKNVKVSFSEHKEESKKE
jgi:LemA protein